MDIQTLYSPIRHPESNPTERVMRELGKYFRIYCDKTHKKWPELVPYVENWLNSSASSTTGYAPLELLQDCEKPDIFRKILKKTPDQMPPNETLADKLLKAYAKAKLKARKRRIKKKTKSTKWDPEEGDLVLVKSQPTSDAAQGITGKFQRPYEGPFIIQKFIPPAMYELCDEVGKLRGLFHLRHMKPYLKEQC
jgi:hypothetical protein